MTHSESVVSRRSPVWPNAALRALSSTLIGVSKVELGKYREGPAAMPDKDGRSSDTVRSAIRPCGCRAPAGLVAAA